MPFNPMAAKDLNPVAKKTLKNFGFDADKIADEYKKGLVSLAVAHDSLKEYVNRVFPGYHDHIHAQVEKRIPPEQQSDSVPRDNRVCGECISRSCEFLFLTGSTPEAYKVIVEKRQKEADTQ
jgi:hypothetical protein